MPTPKTEAPKTDDDDVSVSDLLREFFTGSARPPVIFDDKDAPPDADD